MKTIDKVLKHMKAKGLNQDSLEPLAGLPRGRITRWKDDKGEISGRQALTLSRVLGVDLVYLLDEEMDREPPATLPPDEVAVLALYRSLVGSGLVDVEGALKRLAGKDPFGHTNSVK